MYYYLLMKTIYNIYESILGDPSTQKQKMKQHLDDWNNTFFNRLIRIIVGASGMNAQGEENFKKVMYKFADKFPHFTCYIPTHIKCDLQAISNKTLQKELFNGFANDKKEHDFQFAIGAQILTNEFPQVYDFVNNKISYTKNNFSVIGEDKKGNDLIAGTFGNDTKIVAYDTHIIIWFGNRTKLSIRFLEQPTRTNSRPTRE